MFVLGLLIGLVLLVKGADLLVAGGGQLALALRVPALVVGLTVVAFGTSAPELIVSVTAALEASTDMALANVNGSNIANIALVLGLAALVAPLTVDRVLVRREIPACLILQGMVPLLGWDGRLSRLDGFLLLLGGIIYNALLLYAALYGRPPPVDGDLSDEEPWYWSMAKLVVGIVVLVLGARLFVGGAVGLALALGFSERFVGLSVVALGTSAPEVATGVASARRGEVDLAVGNSLGSNLLNISMVLGITALITPIHIADDAARWDMLTALAVTFILIPVVFQGVLTRLQGGVLAAGYVAYIVYGALG